MKKIILLLLLSSTICLGQKKYCKKITKQVDVFSDEITYYSPLLEVISFSKSHNNIYMSIRFAGASLTDGYGVKILLENKDIIDIDAEIKVDVNNYAQFEYSTFFKLTEYQIKLLKEHLITNIRLYIHDIKIRKPEKYLNYLKCIDEKTL